MREKKKVEKRIKMMEIETESERKRRGRIYWVGQ